MLNRYCRFRKFLKIAISVTVPSLTFNHFLLNRIVHLLFLPSCEDDNDVYPYSSTDIFSLLRGMAALYADQGEFTKSIDFLTLLYKRQQQMLNDETNPDLSE